MKVVSQKLNEPFFKIKIVSTDGNIVYLAKVNPESGLELRCSCDDGFPHPSFKWSELFKNFTTKVMSVTLRSWEFGLELDNIQYLIYRQTYFETGQNFVMSPQY